jgi:hypothetical protein
MRYLESSVWGPTRGRDSSSGATRPKERRDAQAAVGLVDHPDRQRLLGGYYISPENQSWVLKLKAPGREHRSGASQTVPREDR